MESIIIGGLSGLGIMVLYFAYFIIKDIEGWKGKLSRSIFYLIIAAIILLMWAYNPERFEDVLTWGFYFLIAWYCLKIVLEHWQAASEKRQKEEQYRHQTIMNELEIIKSKLNEIEKNKVKEWL